MKTTSFREVVLLSILLFVLNTVQGQIAKTEYFMKTSYMKTYLNPALRPDQGQLVVPVLPNVGANIQTNTINLDHLTFDRGGNKRVTFLSPEVSNNDFLGNMSDNNYIRTDVNYKIFAVGLFHNNRYTTIDLGVRVHADVNLPKSVFELLKVGFDQDHATSYDLNNISATAQSFVELGFGQSRPFLNNTLMLGGRVKALFGAGYLDLSAEKFNITAGPDEWRSIAKVNLRGAAPGVTPKFDSKEQLDGFDFEQKGLPGYGLGLDLGVVYDLQAVLPTLSGLKISAAVNDIGFIKWTRGNTLSLHSSTQEVIIDPSELEHDDGKSIQKVFDDAFDKLREAADLNQVDEKKSVTTSLRATMYLGAEYELIKHKLSLGALYSARFGNYYTSNEVTMSANYQPSYWFGLTGSYSVVHSAFDTFGLALHLAPRKGVTFFVASDYVIPHVSSQFFPTSSKAINIQLGFSIPIGKVSSVKF